MRSAPDRHEEGCRARAQRRRCRCARVVREGGRPADDRIARERVNGRGPNKTVRMRRCVSSYIVASSGAAPRRAPATRSLPVTTPPSTSGWTTFWDKGGWWRAVLVAVVYLALYLARRPARRHPLRRPGRLRGPVRDAAERRSSACSSRSPSAPSCSSRSSRRLHWFPALFARQPIGGRWWMWLAPVAVVAAIVLRLLGIDYASYAAGVVAITLRLRACSSASWRRSSRAASR